jgi:hypothetical protein
MPVHDWTKVVAGNFHDFHQRWVVAISDVLNGGRLPSDHYAMVEQVAGGLVPDVLTLERRTKDDTPDSRTEPWTPEANSGVVALAERPPRVTHIEEPDADVYAARADRVAIYHANGHRVVAYIEVVSPGNKDGTRKIEQFVTKLSRALEAGCHLLVVDVLPPGRSDREGIHAAFWNYQTGGAHGVTEEKRLGVSAYRADDPPSAYFEPIAVGQELPHMPLFLTPAHYVDVPLEATYMEAWQGVPEYWRGVMEG